MSAVLAVAVTGTFYFRQGAFPATDIDMGKIVEGTTGTSISVTQYGHHKGCAYSHQPVSGTNAAPTRYDLMRTASACSLAGISPENSTTGAVAVMDLGITSTFRTGIVLIKTQVPGFGHFSKKRVCSLVPGRYRLNFTAGDEFLGTVTMYANYHGTPLVYKSRGTTDW
jgi:hypothetical protein